MGCKAVCLNALIGLFVSAIVGLSLYGFPGGLEGEKKDPFGEALVQLSGNIGRSIRYGFITSGVKSLSFFISKCMQFRFSKPLHSASSKVSKL